VDAEKEERWRDVDPRASSPATHTAAPRAGTSARRKVPAAARRATRPRSGARGTASGSRGRFPPRRRPRPVRHDASVALQRGRLLVGGGAKLSEAATDWLEAAEGGLVRATARATPTNPRRCAATSSRSGPGSCLARRQAALGDPPLGPPAARQPPDGRRPQREQHPQRAAAAASDLPTRPRA
jgi:hypothetical protein